MTILYNYWIHLLDTDGNRYRLRQDMLTAVKILYRLKGETQSYTECFDYNIDEKEDAIWFRLPESNGQEVELVVNCNVSPLRTVCTAVETVILTPYTTGFDCYATPVPLNSLQGYSPRIIEVDGKKYWHQYDDEAQTFVNTGIEATATIVEGSTEVVDVVQPNNLNPVTSNAVYVAVNNIYGDIQIIQSNIENLYTSINNLQSKKVKVKINGATIQEDATGTIDLGTLNSDELTMLQAQQKINGTIYPKGTAYTVAADGKIEIKATDGYTYKEQTFSNTQDTQNNWWFIGSISSSIMIEVKHIIYNTAHYGYIFIEKNGYNGVVTTTSDFLKNCIFYTVDAVGSMSLYIKGGYMVSPTLMFKYNGGFLWRPARCNSSITPEAIGMRRMNVYLTNETKDWVHIEDDEYSISPAEMIHNNYIIDESVTFTFTDDLTYPVNLQFSNTTNGSVVTVTDGLFTATSRALQAGEIATLIFSSKDSFVWNYSVQPDTVLSITQNDVTYYPDADGNVTLPNAGTGEGTVKSVSVNGGDAQLPDDEGNVDLDIETYTVELGSGTDECVKDIKFNNTTFTTDTTTGETNIGTPVINFLGADKEFTYNETTKKHTATLPQLQVVVNGTTKQFSQYGIVDLGEIGGGAGGTVKSISVNNGESIEPDDNGNVELGKVAPDQFGTTTDYDGKFSYGSYSYTSIKYKDAADTQKKFELPYRMLSSGGGTYEQYPYNSIATVKNAPSGSVVTPSLLREYVKDSKCGIMTLCDHANRTYYTYNSTYCDTDVFIIPTYQHRDANIYVEPNMDARYRVIEVIFDADDTSDDTTFNITTFNHQAGSGSKVIYQLKNHTSCKIYIHQARSNSHTGIWFNEAGCITIMCEGEKVYSNWKDVFDGNYYK